MEPQDKNAAGPEARGRSKKSADPDFMEYSLTNMFKKLAPHLDERQRQLLLAAEAQILGWGGISKLAEATGTSRKTIQNGLRELEEPPLPRGRVRQEGGGRKPLTEHDPELLAALDALVAPSTRGDPMSPLRWTCKSTRALAETLTNDGHPVSHQLVSELLQDQGYSLQANVKTREGAQHPDRDAQFQYINNKVQDFLGQGLPVLSVDAKKKENIGEFKNGGQEWQPKGQPEEVNVHDFMDKELGKAIPYGVYDSGRNSAWVVVGQDHDTSAFAVESIRRWWQGEGSLIYPDAKELLICADGGGSNGSRVRLWKYELARLATDAGLSVTVCHLPPGTSKWNKIEHRLFAHITMNWRGRPLTSHDVVVNLINSTTTRQGLKVHAEQDTRQYPTGVKVSDKDMKKINLKKNNFHGEWNYTILPDMESQN
jgi:DNA-binding phage protein